MRKTLDLFYSFYWVILRRLNFIRRRFGIHCKFHLHRRFKFPANTACEEKETQYSETSAYKIQTSGNNPKKEYNI